MSDQAPPSPTPRWHVTLRSSVALLCCVIILAITIPNLSGLEIWQDALSIGMILVPLVLILVGIGRSRITEAIGWVLMVILLALRFST